VEFQVRGQIHPSQKTLLIKKVVVFSTDEFHYVGSEYKFDSSKELYQSKLNNQRHPANQSGKTPTIITIQISNSNMLNHTSHRH